MKALGLKKESTLTSFTLSALVHGMVVVGFALWSRSHHQEFNLVKLPSVISISLDGLKGSAGKSLPLKVSSKKTSSLISSTQTTSVQNVSSLVSENTAAAATFSEGIGSGASKDGVIGGTGTADASILTIKQKYFLEFRHTIESKKEYPAMARMRGIEGVVVVSVTIKKNGEVINHKVVKASGFDVLDQSALNLVKKITMFKSLPVEIGSEDVELKFPIAYSLNG